MSEPGVVITLEAIYKTLMEVRDEQRSMAQMLKGYDEVKDKVGAHTVHIKWLWTIITLGIGGVAKGLYGLFSAKGGN